ncbi:hypothetical protein JMM81_07755 [Bacillus sp. V3B]|uniref:hypothetical protein n=1 Tax=Bacillus sp. V3B TaxID=2804915 RepID=UPI00210EA71C|nr:hypothetical protein [Bacillus sp. V3B]MCQ6274859.1 hypothetical protein [Bacillus sp. V3B]
MDISLKNCAGLDVHQKEIIACVIREATDRSSITEVRSFPTMTKDLYELLK